MRFQPILFLTIVIILLATSCKKDEEAQDEDNTCTETRPIWLDGIAGDFTFVTSEPCGNLRLNEVDVNQRYQSYGGHLFILQTIHDVVDSLSDVKGTFKISIAAIVANGLVDTVINATDTTYEVTAGSICSSMKLGKHYNYIAAAVNNNANAFIVEYTDTLGGVWQSLSAVTDTTFVVTSIDGTISQSPGGGAYFPYCATSFKYDVQLIKQGAADDTLHVKGTGRIGFR